MVPLSWLRKRSAVAVVRLPSAQAGISLVSRSIAKNTY